MSARTYHLVQIKDLLQVPADRREDCVREVLLTLAFTELAGLENLLEGVHWTDDGDRSVTIPDPEGNPLMTLRVTKLENKDER